MNQVKKIPLRKCIGCGEQKNKNDLIRIVRESDGNIFADHSGRANGRGAYICKDPACFLKACKSHALERSFKVNISAEEYAKLGKEFLSFEQR